MDWRKEGVMLERILALLVSLAGLADRAGGQPLSLQLTVLGHVARGEDVARSFIAGLPFGAMAAFATSRAGDRAERLAADLRLLARILRALLARARLRARSSTRDTVLQAGCLLPPRGPGGADACPAAPPRAPDTS